jgi:hypothetical protein
MSRPESSLSGKLEALERGAEKSTGHTVSVKEAFGKLRSVAQHPKVCRKALSGEAAKPQVLRGSSWATGLSRNHIVYDRGRHTGSDVMRFYITRQQYRALPILSGRGKTRQNRFRVAQAACCCVLESSLHVYRQSHLSPTDQDQYPSHLLW